MKLQKRSIRRALGLAAALLVTGLGVALVELRQPVSRSASVEQTPPALKGEMGDFSHFVAPRPVPPISFVDGAGQPLSLADFKGRVVLVNFWATWCAPCVREMPSLDRLQARLGGPDFTVLDLSLDRQGKDAVAPYFTENKLDHLGIYLDAKGEAFRAWQGRGVPTSFIIGRDGLARGILLGPADWDSAAATALIRRFIAEGKGDNARPRAPGAGSTG